MVDDRVEQEFADRDRQNPDRGADGQFLQQHDGDEQDDEQPQGVGHDAGQGGHEQFGERGHDGRLLPAAGLAELFVVPLVHLHRVADRARGDEERDHQRERVQAEADQRDEAESPDRGDHAGQGRTQGAAHVAEIGVQQQPQQHGGRNEDDVHLLGVEIDPAVQRRLAGHVDARILVLKRVDHRPLDFLEQAPVVEPLLDEGRGQQRGSFVQRDQHPVQVARGVHDAPDALHLRGGARGVFHHRLDLLHAAALHHHAAVGAVGDGIDEFVVDSVHALQRLGHLEDLGQRGLIEDRAVVHLQHQHDRVGAAELLRVFVVHLNEGVALRQLLVEARHQVEPCGEEAEEQGRGAHRQEDELAPRDDPSAEGVEIAAVLGAHAVPSRVSGCERVRCGSWRRRITPPHVGFGADGALRVRNGAVRYAGWAFTGRMPPCVSRGRR